MTLKKITGISAAAIMAVMMSATVSAQDEKYLQDSYGNGVKDSYGDCVKAAFGNMAKGCEAAPEPAPAPPPLPAPAPVPAPAPAPAPIQQISLSADANFDFDKAVLKPAGQAEIDAFLGKLAGAKVTGINVIGHTDSIGAEAYNQKLSEKRAAAVANYMVSKGVPPEALRVSGRGESQPVADNSTKAGRAANRRVDVTAVGTR